MIIMVQCVRIMFREPEGFPSQNLSIQNCASGENVLLWVRPDVNENPLNRKEPFEQESKMMWNGTKWAKMIYFEPGISFWNAIHILSWDVLEPEYFASPARSEWWKPFEPETFVEPRTVLASAERPSQWMETLFPDALYYQIVVVMDSRTESLMDYIYQRRDLNVGSLYGMIHWLFLWITKVSKMNREG